MEFTIAKDKKITFRRGNNNYELETATFSDSTFNQLTQYLEILKFDKYKNKYEFAGFDGSNYKLTVKTNLYTKTIETYQRPTQGLRNLISFIDLRLQTEINTTVNIIHN